MASTAIVPAVDEGLGNSAYLVDLGDGRCAGHTEITIVRGGPDDWSQATRVPLEAAIPA